MIKIKCYLGLWLFFLACPVLASSFSTIGSWTGDSIDKFELSAAYGPNWTHTSNTHLIVSPYETDSVLVNHISNQSFWKIGMGYHFFADTLKHRRFFNDLLIELNVYESLATLSGNVWQYELPQFNNYAFNAPITSTRLMIDFKPGLVNLGQLSLHAIVGMGNAWNNVAYNETVTGIGIAAGSNYLLTTSSNTHFAYDLGVGLRFDFTNFIGATVEYLYTNLGNMTSTGTSQNSDSINSTPTFNMYNQGVLFGLSWKI